MTVSLVILLSLGFHQFMGYFYVLPLLETLEIDDGEKNLKRAVLAVNRDLDHLNMFCYDWAEWDDSYRFVTDCNEEFIESNLLENTFLHNRLALLFFVDKGGHVVWGRCYSGELEEFITIEEFPEDNWPPDHPLLQHRSNTSYLKGYLKSSEGPMMLVSRPIVPSNGVGEIHGTLVMGRLICDKCVEMMRERTQVDMELWSMDCDTLSEKACHAKAGLSDLHPSCFVRDADWIYGYSYFTDIYNQPAILIQTKAWRTVYKKCREGVMVDMVASIFTALVVVTLISYLLHRLVGSPLARFSDAISKIHSSGKMTQINVHFAHDEIGHLQQEFNQMIRRLHDDAEKRSLVEDALRLSKASLSAVLEAAPDGIMTLDDGGLIKSINPAASMMFDYKADYLLGRNILILTDPQQRTLLKEEIAKLRQDPASSVFSLGVEVSGLRRDGSHLLVHCKVGLVEGGAGDARFICIVRDVSGLKEIHERLMRTKHLASIGEMGASIAHEIRNPLAGISGAVQVLTDRCAENNPDYAVLKEISRLSGRIEGTVQQMLEYAKDWQPEPKLCEIVALINEKVVEYRHQAGVGEMVIRVEGRADIRALLDPVLIGQVMVNLMDNAVASCAGSRGELVWRVEKNLRDVCITLQDNGCGISKDVLEHILKPFFTTKVNGHGLGLAICQKIVERHNGTISIESEVGVGTRVIIILPKSKFLKA
ncbi:MAG: PAS domain S-box protein [Deltaproteobacteria bacterium]|nr:PAS domain S-box protein [Deltaproteobacteria bacterium]